VIESASASVFFLDISPGPVRAGVESCV
jgi:hypothetical protein